MVKYALLLHYQNITTHVQHLFFVHSDYSTNSWSPLPISWIYQNLNNIQHVGMFGYRTCSRGKTQQHQCERTRFVRFWWTLKKKKNDKNLPRVSVSFRGGHTHTHTPTPVLEPQRAAEGWKSHMLLTSDLGISTVSFSWSEIPVDVSKMFLKRASFLSGQFYRVV